MKNIKQKQPFAMQAKDIYRSIRLAIPHEARFFLRKVLYSFSDAIYLLQGKNKELIPPKSLNFVGGGDFKKVGDQIVQDLRNYCDLRPHEKVLDVGCGIGRVAIPLTKYLDAQGSYEGFDIVPQGITWCQKKITPQYPHFRFQLADIYNKSYHPKGKQQSCAYRFPYPDSSFDVVFLTSVFTHMLPADLEQYLREIARVLKPNGRSLITYFLLNPESLRDIEQGISSIKFQHAFDTYRILRKREPEAAVGYNEGHISDLYNRYGLTQQKTLYGTWCGRTPQANTYQDIIIGHRKA